MESIRRALRDGHVEGRQHDVHLVPEFVDPMVTAVGSRIDGCHVVAIVGKLLAGGEAGGFADDFVGFDHELFAVAMLDDPFAAEQRDNTIGGVANRDEIDEGMRFVRRQSHAAMVVHEFVEMSGQAFEWCGSGHWLSKERSCLGFANTRLFVI